MMTLYVLNDIANDAESIRKIERYVILASLKSVIMGNLKNRLPGLRLLISSLPRLSFENAW